MSTFNVLFCFLVVSANFFLFKCHTCQEEDAYYAIRVDCKDIVGQFPAFSKTIKWMSCLNCNIPIVDENTLANFTGGVFNLNNSHVQSINSSIAFRKFGTEMLEFLFAGNEINYIAPGVFANISRLQKIVFMKNKIGTLEKDMFRDTKVWLLDLSYNNLQLSADIFSGLQVTILNISNNGIVDLPACTFHDIFWPGLEWHTHPQQLDLSNNLIAEIRPDVFSSSTENVGIRKLYMSHNKLSVIRNDTFSQLEYLSYLSLEGNSISELNFHSFRGLKNLDTLILKDNEILTLPTGMFGDLSSLNELDLSMNKLQTLHYSTFSGLPYLQELNLSHNNLRVLHDTHLFPLGLLTSLDITDTKLRDINLKIMLETHGELRDVIINDNFWSCKKLAEMYNLLNERKRGFVHPSTHFEVPNLHGIACTPTQLSENNDLTFVEFLGKIGVEKEYAALQDSVSQEYDDLTSTDSKETTNKAVNGIYSMFLTVTILMVFLFVQFAVICVWYYLSRRKEPSPNIFSIFKYTRSNDNPDSP